MHIKPNKAGIAVGSFAAVVHIGWSLLIAFGWAQPLIDFIFRLHMVRPVYEVEPFDLATALGLVVVTAAIGFVVGTVFARIWNNVGGKG
jgi:hypothetical protein